MIGVYDVFSATLAARHFDGLFLSGFSFAASHYGLPDRGYIAWTDMLGFAQRLRAVLPRHHLLVDIDDGYGDPEIVAHVVQRMEQAGVSGVVLEDQQRPRRCGHYEGKQILPLNDYLEKLRAALAARRDLVIVARTDTPDADEARRRLAAFAETGADAVLAEAVPSLDALRSLSAATRTPLACNQIAGGKTPAWSIAEMGAAGVRIVIYSTPCLFAAQGAIAQAMQQLRAADGRLPPADSGVTLAQSTAVLNANVGERPAGRD